MKDPNREADRWLSQAENDLEFARTGFREGFYVQVCFLCQQVGEKAVKAIHYHRGRRNVLSHSIYQRLKELNLRPEEVKSDLEALELFYETAAYGC